MKQKIELIKTILSWCVVAIAVIMVIFTFFSITTLNKYERNIFGWKFYIVKTDSMSLSENNKDMDVHFNSGDIVIAKNVTAQWRLNNFTPLIIWKSIQMVSLNSVKNV